MAQNDELITLADVRKYRDVDSQFSSVRFSAFLKEVQDIDLQEFLGSTLWYHFFTNITDEKYQNLLNGEEYVDGTDTLYFDGLKPFLVWAWLVILPLENNVHHTQSGMVDYMHSNTRMPSSSAINQAKEVYKKNMIAEQNKIINYLNVKNDIYTLWNSKCKENGSSLNFDII